MPSMLVQFHAMAEDLGLFLAAAEAEYAACVTVARWHPFSLAKMDGSSNSVEWSRFLRDSGISAAYISDRQVISAATSGAVIDKNPGVVVLTIGRFVNDGVEESSLSYRSHDSSGIDFAKRVFGKLKKLSVAGGVARSLKSGETMLLRAHRFMPLAVRAASQGLNLYSLGRGSILTPVTT